MKTFEMYVRTVIYNEQDKILLLNKKTKNKKPSWDLPGSAFTEEQSFDETVINNIPKEIGYYVYPGKIIGISDYLTKKGKEVNVIMEGTILNGDLLLSKDYETHTWVTIDRINDYPLAPWLKNYMQNNKYPFEDVENEIEENTNKIEKRRESIKLDFRKSTSSSNSSEKRKDGSKSSFSLLKDTIVRTFHPQEAKMRQTKPKSKELHHETVSEELDNETVSEEKTGKRGFFQKLNINRSKNKEQEEKDLQEAILNNTEDDIIIDHGEDSAVQDTHKDISIDYEKDSEDKIVLETEEEIVPNNKIQKTSNEDKKTFDMNINRTQNMKEKTAQKEDTEPVNEPEIKIIHQNEETPHIRKEKESKEKVSFNSENIKRIGWKERLNKINRTKANNEKKRIPKPKGKKK